MTRRLALFRGRNTGSPRLHDKVAVVTGAASGIGRALARQLAREGCRLALVDIQAAGLAETVRQLPPLASASAYVVDVSNREAFRTFVATVVADHGRVDIVINNAGVLRLHSIREASYEDYENSLNVNLWGVLYGCKEFLPYLKQRPEAWLVNMSSGAGLVGFAHYSSYNMSKFAVRGLTECLRDELKGTSVSVSCVHPGGVATNLLTSGVHSQDAASSAAALSRALRQMTPDQAAVRIVDGMLKKQERILIGRDVRLLDLAARWFPASYHWVVALFAIRPRIARRVAIACLTWKRD